MKTIKPRKEGVDLIECIELGLNLIAQDLIWETHSEEDVNCYIKHFGVIET